MRAAAKPIPENPVVEVFSLVNLFYFYFPPPFLHMTKTPDKHLGFGEKVRLEKENFFSSPIYGCNNNHFTI